MDRSSPDLSGPTRLRRLGIASSVAVSVLAVLAITVMVNYLAGRYPWRLAVVEDPRFQLSGLTRSLLRNLTQDVDVIVFCDPDPGEALFASIKGLLTEYELVCPRLRVEYVDYLRDPGRAVLVRAEYPVATGADAEMVIFASGGRHQVLRFKELSDYDVSGALRGEPIRRTTFKGEQLFTSAILGVTEGKPRKALYVVGHGEHPLASEDPTLGYREFARALRDKNIEVEPVSLSTNGVPADCSLLVLAGPRYALPADELWKIREYLQAGGRALVLLGNSLRPEVSASGLEPVLAGWRVAVGNNLVMDRAQSKADVPQVVMVGAFGSHAVTRPLFDARLQLVMPRSVRALPSAPTGEGIEVTELFFTGPSGVALAQSEGRGVVETNGVIPLAVAVEGGAIAGVSADRGSTRLVVVGESLFLANAAIEAGANRDFLGLAVDWLLDRTQLLGLGPRPIAEYGVSLTPGEMRRVFWILLAAMPGSVLALGVLVWFWRRR